VTSLAAPGALLTAPLALSFGSGDGVSTPLTIVVFALLLLSPFVLGLALRLADRRRERRGPAAAGRTPWAERPLAVLVLAAAVGWGVAVLVT
jgi:hypothetical protein